MALTDLGHDRIDDRLIVEVWEVCDGLGRQEQIGIGAVLRRTMS